MTVLHRLHHGLSTSIDVRYSSRSQDRDDLVAMWPLAGLSPSEALDRYQLGYPHAPEDEFLLGWIEAIAEESAGVGPRDE